MSTSNGRIVVIDDEPVICSGIKLALEEKGYSVDTCLNGREGRQAIGTNHYDVALLDVKLPDDDGMEILQKIRQENADLQVIVMTGYATVDNAVAAMKQGSFDYIAKPFTDEQLIQDVEKAIEHKHLREENLSLRQQLSERYDFGNIIGENRQIVKLFDQIRKAAPTESTVLLQGESGTGKELFARAIHINSLRATRQFIAVDCSTFSASLLESELFGHVKGAFTGAQQDKAGIFEMARGGTLFLDEVSNLSAGTQSKLLRVMDSGEYRPVGSGDLKKADVRIIAATNQFLQSMVADGKFREDLFYRLNVLPLCIPPLRQRKDDVPRLLYHFLKVYRRKTGKHIDGFTDEALEILARYDWPGNVRQLKNVVERLVIMADERMLDSANLDDHLGTRRIHKPEAIPDTLTALKAIKDQWMKTEFCAIEKAFVQKALAAESGNITRAARRVGMQRSNFSALMKKCRLKTDITVEAL